MQGKVVDNESLVNLPNWLAVTFRIDGEEWFAIDTAAADLLEYRQSLDLGSGLFERVYRFRDDAGRTTRVRQRRFASMHLRTSARWSRRSRPRTGQGRSRSAR